MAPLKTFRPFGRRKSSANVLDEIKNAPGTESSFRVLERPSHIREKSFDGGVKLARAYQPTRPDTMYALESENIFDDYKSHRFRGSGGSTSNITSTTDNSSRFSATSTAPSSIDDSKQHDSPAPVEKTPAFTPPPQSKSPFSLKATGRNFSFGLGKEKKSTNPADTEPSSPVAEVERPLVRPRSQTFDLVDKLLYPVGSRQSQPPSPHEPESHFFSGFGRRKSKIPAEFMAPRTSKSISDLAMTAALQPPAPVPSPIRRSPQPPPPPLKIDHHTPVEDPPYSWTSRRSTDELMQVANMDIAPARRDTASEPPPPVPKHTVSFAEPPPSNDTSDEMDEDDVFLERTISEQERDNVMREEQELLQNSLALSELMEDSAPPAPVETYQPRTMAANTPPVDDSKPKSSMKQRQGTYDGAQQLDNNMFESKSAIARQPSPQVLSHFKAEGRNKVMTREQFEEYKRAQERKKRIDDERIQSVGGKPAKDDDEEDDDVYEEEVDETEKRRVLAQARRKQEAHLAVYRQQMMKVTGESAPMPPLNRPGMQTSPSVPNFVVTSNDEEEDDEVPLGILAAHGFPNKTRQPGQLKSMESMGNLGGMPTSNGALPVFAKNLPQDPYVGASLVNATNRESLSYGGASPFTNPNAPKQTTGLVNVIVKEERDRAMRRAGTQVMGESSHPMPPPHPNMAQQQQYMGMPNGPMSPAEQTQLAMTQQMQQFMSMQMQFMTQMMTSDAQQSQGSPQASPNFLGPQSSPHFLNSQERASTMSRIQPPSATMLRPGSSASQHRTMSTLNANAAPWLQSTSTLIPSSHVPGNSYAPSMAPSERSNVGQPGRYRPVTNTPSPLASKDTSRPGSLVGTGPTAAAKTIRKVVSAPIDDDEDDELAWAMVKQMKEKKKSAWRAKQGLDISAIKF